MQVCVKMKPMIFGIGFCAGEDDDVDFEGDIKLVKVIAVTR